MNSNRRAVEIHYFSLAVIMNRHIIASFIFVQAVVSTTFMQPAEAFDFAKEELRILRLVYRTELSGNGVAGNSDLLTALSQLAALYKGRYDEYSAIRSRILALEPLTIPPRGGPFPRIGLPASTYDGRKMRPPSLLSRWLNKDRLPELYKSEQVSISELEKSLKIAIEQKGSTGREIEATDALLEKLGALYCAQARFNEADKVFRAVLADRENAGDNGSTLTKADLAALSQLRFHLNSNLK